MTSKAFANATDANRQQGGRRNLILNGNFDVWQRGTGAATSTGYHNADRWTFIVTSATVSGTQGSFTVGQTDVPDKPDYYLSTSVTTASTSTEIALVGQRIEGLKRAQSKDKVTISFYAKADGTKDITVEFNQKFGVGGSSNVNSAANQTFTLTSSWQKYTATIDLPSLSGKTFGTEHTDSLEIFFWFSAGSNFNSRTNSLGNQSGTFDIAQVQLEVGDTATPFEHRSYGEELTLCKRYFQAFGSGGGSVYAGINAGLVSSGTSSFIAYQFYPEMRSAPTHSFTGSFRIMSNNGLFVTGTGNVEASSNGAYIRYDHSGGGGTSGYAGLLSKNNDQSARIYWDAEL